MENTRYIISGVILILLMVGGLFLMFQLIQKSYEVSISFCEEEKGGEQGYNDKLGFFCKINDSIYLILYVNNESFLIKSGEIYNE